MLLVQLNKRMGFLKILSFFPAHVPECRTSRLIGDVVESEGREGFITGRLKDPAVFGDACPDKCVQPLDRPPSGQSGIDDSEYSGPPDQ